LDVQWEQREGRLWRRGLDAVPKSSRVKQPPPPTPPALSPGQRAKALALLRSGLSLRKVAAKFPGVSCRAIWRLTRAEASADEIEGTEEEEGTDEEE
jgi:hypothetical protein